MNIVVAVYAVLFMNWDTKDTPFDGVSGLLCRFQVPLVLMVCRSGRTSLMGLRLFLVRRRLLLL